MTAITTATHIDAQTQEELMRQAGIWIEHSTLIEDDLPARPLAAVQAEKHHLDRYTQLVADRAAARESKCLAQIGEPAAPATVVPQGVVAWMHPETLHVISAAHKHDMSTEYGAETRRKAESYSVALVRAGEPAAAAPALEAPAAPAGEGSLPSSFDVRIALQFIHDTFKKDLDAGYRTKDKEFAVSVAAPALASAPQAPAQEAPAATALAAEFTDQSIADPVEKARRYLKAMADEAPNSVYFFDDGYPRRASSQDAKAALVVLEQLAARAPAPQAPAAPSGLPSGWVPCILTHDGQHPEEVAYGPQIMMDRLKKWLGRYFELLAQKVLAEPVQAEMLAALQAVAMDVVHVGAGENTISDAARAKVEAVLEKIGAPWPGPAAAPAAPAVDALDAARLDWLEEQAKQSPTGISFDYVLHAEDGQVLEKGWRFMRRHFLGERKSNLRAAIDAAQAAAKGASDA